MNKKYYLNISGDEDFYNIAHMTNTPAAVEWAVNKGANAIEIDLTFDTSTGLPAIFRHSDAGIMCDCTCYCPWGFYWHCSSLTDNVCSVLREGVSGISPCRAESSMRNLLANVASHTSLALVIVDSKISSDTMDDAKMRIAGEAIVDALHRHLFRRGYGGQVVIGSSGFDTAPYLRAAIARMRNSQYESKAYFSIDQGSTLDATMQALQDLPTQNIIFSYGLTACSTWQFDTQTLQQAKRHTRNRLIGMTYIWTVDIPSTMRYNLQYVNGILSNYPGIVRDVLEESGKTLATQRSIIPSTRY